MLHVPEAQGSLLPGRQPGCVRRTRTSLGRAVRTAYRGTTGKEGPYVHISTCVAQQLCRLPLFRRLNETESLRRQMLAAGCAAGVAATFGAPVGGVLFSIEVTLTLLYYRVTHLWKPQP